MSKHGVVLLSVGALVGVVAAGLLLQSARTNPAFIEQEPQNA